MGSLDFGLSEGILFFVRVIATVGGAVVGWFATDPLTRLIYRLSYKGPTPGSVLFGAKFTGAVTLAILIWFFMPLGGGGGGLGWGPGLGGGPGKGPGQGGDKTGNAQNGKDAKDAKNKTAKTEPEREPVKIEILGGARFVNDGEERYYQVLRKGEAARSLKELEAFLKKDNPSLIEIVHTDDTALDNTEDSPTVRLQRLATKLDIPHKGPKN
jgi:hypothetical protein